LGQYQVAPTYNLNGIYVSNNYGSTWTKTGTVVDSYYSLYISYSGKYMIIMAYSDKMYKSTNFGASFSVAFTSLRPGYYFFSQDETYHGYVSSTSRLNISSNSGSSFAIPSALSSVSILNYGIPAAFSQNGKYQLAISATNIYVSNNNGSTYTSNLGGLTGLNTVAMSLDGQYMFVNSSPSLRYSSDFGVTWNVSTGVTGANTLECSYTGKYVSLKTATDIYISSDFGATFTSTYNSTNIYEKRMSLDGKYLIVTKRTDTNLIISKDYGQTWASVSTGITATATTNFMFPKLSADGKYMLLGTNIGTAGYYNYVYVSAN
jgi:hypothetical protein